MKSENVVPFVKPLSGRVIKQLKARFLLLSSKYRDSNTKTL